MRRALGAHSLFVLGAALWPFGSLTAHAGTTIKPPEEIVIGMSVSLTGVSSDTGKAAAAGARAAVEQANRAGGVGGQIVRLVVLDDGADAAQAGRNVRALAVEHGALAILGPSEPRTGLVAARAAASLEVPLLSLGDEAPSSPSPWIIRMRPSPAEQAAAIIDSLTEQAGVRPNQVALVTERSARGQSAYEGGLASLLRHCECSRLRVVHTQLDTDNTAVEGALADLILASPAPRAVMVFASADASANLVRRARELGITALFVCAGGDGATLASALPDDGGVVVTTSTPPPASGDADLSEQARAASLAVRAVLSAAAGTDHADRPGIAAELRKFDSRATGSPNQKAPPVVWTWRVERGKLISLAWASLRPGIAAGTETNP